MPQHKTKNSHHRQAWYYDSMSDAFLPEILTRGVETVLPSREGLTALMQQKRLRLYLGIDPTGNQLHFGHAVVLRKLQQFAAAGHEVILLIGNGTVKIGDPTGKDKTRPMLTDEEIETNFQTWKEQAAMILDFDAITIMRNGDWLDLLTFPDMVQLLSRMTVQQLLERDMFQERLKNNLPIYAHEIIYPLLQGFDSVVMDVDLEIGGVDQLFNMMVGRQLQRDINGREKFVLGVPLLVGSDGRKMGKSLNNFIPLTAPPNDMYGKIMSVVDEVIVTYFRLLTDIPTPDIDALEASLQNGSLHPMDAKKQLAHWLTSFFHSAAEADAAAEHFTRTVQAREVPTDIPRLFFSPGMTTLDVVSLLPMIPSRSEARRLIQQGAIELNGEKLSDPLAALPGKVGDTLRIGKRQYYRLVEASDFPA